VRPWRGWSGTAGPRIHSVPAAPARGCAAFAKGVALFAAEAAASKTFPTPIPNETAIRSPTLVAAGAPAEISHLTFGCFHGGIVRLTFVNPPRLQPRPHRDVPKGNEARCLVHVGEPPAQPRGFSAAAGATNRLSRLADIRVNPFRSVAVPDWPPHRRRKLHRCALRPDPVAPEGNPTAARSQRRLFPST
jgi:hypothetical protein